MALSCEYPRQPQQPWGPRGCHALERRPHQWGVPMAARRWLWARLAQKAVQRRQAKRRDQDRAGCWGPAVTQLTAWRGSLCRQTKGGASEGAFSARSVKPRCSTQRFAQVMTMNLRPMMPALAGKGSSCLFSLPGPGGQGSQGNSNSQRSSLTTRVLPCMPSSNTGQTHLGQYKLQCSSVGVLTGSGCVSLFCILSGR